MHSELRKSLIAVAVILLAIPVTSLAQSLLYEAFNGSGSTVDAGKWTKVDSEDKIILGNGQLGFKGGKNTPTWGDPAIYTKQSYSRIGGRAFITTIRTNSEANNGLVAHFAPNGFSSAPLTTGYGIAFQDVDAITGGERPGFTAVTPNKSIEYINHNYDSLYGYDPKNASSIDYTLATILRPNSGSFHLVSGGEFGTYPQATLIWANQNGTSASVYAGFSNNNSVSWVDSALVTDLGGDFATMYGLANVADGFSRSGTLDQSTVDQKGTHKWTVNNGSYTADGNKITATAADSIATVTAVSQGIFEVDITAPPTGPYYGGIVFRYQNGTNYWYLLASDSEYVLGKVIGGTPSVVDSNGSISLANGATTRLTVVLHGNSTICLYTNGDLVLIDCVQDTDLSSATGAGVISGVADVSFDNFAVWPRYVTLPSNLPLKPGTVPTSDVNTIISDTFTDIEGLNLASHTMTTGAGWSVPSGSWTISSNTATPSTEGALAVTETTKTDIAVSASVAFPDIVGTDDWRAGLVIRYENPTTYSWARVVWQPEPLLELWDIKDGVANNVAMSPPGLLNSVRLEDLMNENDIKAMTLVAKGNQLAVYLDNSLLLQGTTVNLNGTKAGMINGTDVGTPYAYFDNFVVRDVLADIVPPSAVTDLSVTTSPTKSPAVLSWTAVLDDVGPVNYYRIYRSTSSGSLGSQINTNGTTTGNSYTDNSLTNPGTYYYTVRAVDIAGNESTIVDNKQVSVVFDNTAPIGTVNINAGQATAANSQVILTLTATDNTSPTTNIQILVSNNEGFDGSEWEAFFPTKQWTLTAGIGERTVFYKLRDQALNESGPYSDSIEVTSAASSSSSTSTFASDTLTSTTSSGVSSGELYLLQVKLQLPNGQDAAGVPVTLVSRNQTVTTDANGVAQFENVPRGTHQVKGVQDNFSVDFTFDLPNNQTTNGTYRPVLRLGSDNSGYIWVIAGAAMIIFGGFGSLLYILSNRLRKQRKAQKLTTPVKG